MLDSIRFATREDAQGIREIYAPFCGESPVSFEIVPPTVEEMADRVTAIMQHYPWLVSSDEHGMIRGYVYACRHRERAAYRWAVDVTVYIHPQWRGHGLGKCLYTVLFDLLRLQGFYKAYAGITMPNPASVALHQSLGFTLVGVYHHVGYKAGAWRDVSWWEKALQAEMTDPAEPLSMSCLLGAAEGVFQKWKQRLS